MAAEREPPPSQLRLLDIPQVPTNFVPSTAGERFKLGTMTIRIMEDGSRTDNRLGAAELIIPPHTPGPLAHWHEMHDETFLITMGTVRFHTHFPPPPTPSSSSSTSSVLSASTQKPQTHESELPKGDIDATVGDYVVVPVHSPHTFSNPFDEEARFFNTFSPAYYVHYFKLLSMLAEEAGGLTAEANAKAMSIYATIPVKKK